jgi:hypothetical protein
MRSQNRRESVTARRFLRKMRGGAQAHLIEADDGACYVVKFRNNPQHRRILINELISTEILTNLQISAPEYQIIEISPGFLEQNPDVYIELGTRRQAVEPGCHFGSRHPGNPDTLAIYDFIPDALLNQVANAEQFRAVLVFDRWVANADGRQAIFFRAQLKDWLAGPDIPPRKMGFVVSMIDHGFALDGPHWTLGDSAITGLYPRRAVYQGVKSIEAFDPWLTRVLNFPPEVLDKALRRVPVGWLAGDGGDLNRLLDSLLRRRKRICDIMLDVCTARDNLFPN